MVSYSHIVFHDINYYYMVFIFLVRQHYFQGVQRAYARVGGQQALWVPVGADEAFHQGEDTVHAGHACYQKVRR